LIGDGSLMHYSDGRLALTDRTASPLIDLIEANYVTIYSRNGGRLSEMPLEMQRIPTYRMLVNDHVWPELRSNLQELEIILRNKNAVEAWPTINLGPGFKRLIELAFEQLERRGFEGHLTYSQAERLLEIFKSRINSDPRLPARTVWKESYDAPELRLSDAAKSLLHWLGIETHHYNSAMTSSHNHPSRRVGVVTRYSYLFDGLRVPSMTRALSGASVSELPMPRVPKSMRLSNLRDGSLLSEFTRFGSDLYTEKHKYLAAVHAALMDRNALPDARLAADRYGALISGAATRHDRDEATAPFLNVFHGFLGAAGAELGAMMPHHMLAKPVGTICAPIAGGLVSTVYRRYIQSSVPLAVDVFDPLEDFKESLPTLSEPLQGSQWFAFLPLNMNAASDHVGQLPVF